MDFLESPIYCLDSSAIISALDYYPIDKVPQFWELLKKLVLEKVIFIPREVYNKELKDKDSPLLTKWVNDNNNILRSSTSQTEECKQEVARLYEKKSLPNTTAEADNDIEIIAFSKAFEAKVVTNELPKAHERINTRRCPIKSCEYEIVSTRRENKVKARNIRIPDICDELDVEHTKLAKWILEIDFNTRSIRKDVGHTDPVEVKGEK